MGMDDSSAQHHHQEMSSQTLENMLVCPKIHQEKKSRPDEKTLKCPRCDSPNTKFCYYNNYSLTQPRYFCKSCKRYWTKGGILRNVPVGGGCRKTKRSSPSSKIISQDQPITTIPSLIPCLATSNDLALALARLQKQTAGQLGLDNHEFSMWANQNVPRRRDGVLWNYAFLETPPSGNFQNLYYGMENGGMGIGYEELISGGATTSAVKDEIYNAGEAETKVFLGFPSIGGDCESMNMGECDFGRQSWNGIGSSSQGLLNNPLM